MQSRSSSFWEAVISTFVGFFLSMVIQNFWITPAWGLQLSAGDNFIITMIFTVASIARGYVLRRIFNRRVIAQYLKEKEE